MGGPADDALKKPLELSQVGWVNVNMGILGFLFPGGQQVYHGLPPFYLVVNGHRLTETW